MVNRSFYYDALATQAMVTLTGGVFLIGFALKLGASNFLIGLIAAIPPLMQLLQLPATWLIEIYRDRKRITILAAFLSRMLLLALAAITLTESLALLILVLVIHFGVAAIGGCSWNSWIKDLIPDNELGKTFSKRIAMATALGIPLGLAAAFFVDRGPTTNPYGVLFFLGALAGLSGLLFLARIPAKSLEGERVGLYSLFSGPFRDSNFRNMLMFSGAWNFAVNLAAPFFTVYMLQRLEFSLTLVLLLVTLSQVTHLGFLRLWGRYSDRYSNKSVLAVCGPLFLFSVLLWTFTTLPEKYWLTLPLLVLIHILMGLSMAGVNLALGNIALKLAPKGAATSYLATNSLIASMTAAAAPLIGGLLADFFSARELTLTFAWQGTRFFSFQTLSLQHWDFFFAIAFLIGLYSMHRLTLVKEYGEIEKKVVVQELLSEVKRELRNFSSIGGVQQAVELPFVAAASFFKKIRR